MVYNLIEIDDDFCNQRIMQQHSYMLSLIHKYNHENMSKERFTELYQSAQGILDYFRIKKAQLIFENNNVILAPDNGS